MLLGIIVGVCCPAQPEHRMNGFNEFDVADRLRQRGWVRMACRRDTCCVNMQPPVHLVAWPGILPI